MSSAKELCYKGWQYQFGINVEKDLEKAFEYYKRAADLGDGEGLFQLAEFYHLGIHVEQKAEIQEHHGKISDFGQSRKIGDEKTYGVLPYVDPVLFDGKW
ncbi:9538_t:CDS:2 [Gigaspora rosea]|nr:9538_t:CDS:2 [Gigaspora rosea]